MKTSELILKLQDEIKNNGDVDVLMWEDDVCQHRNVHGVSYSNKENAIIIND